MIVRNVYSESMQKELQILERELLAMERELRIWENSEEFLESIPSDWDKPDAETNVTPL
ncbi:MAG: hypothetical protein LBS46_01980 [Dysgonamonadaceae bacterium]|jgi:hypothetical protein|nr:hypothetical protein [Dysgonamonadaceae bacterium]